MFYCRVCGELIGPEEHVPAGEGYRHEGCVMDHHPKCSEDPQWDYDECPECDDLYEVRDSTIDECVLAIEQAISKENGVLDPKQFSDGSGRRDPYERGIVRGMELALIAIRNITTS